MIEILLRRHRGEIAVIICDFAENVKRAFSGFRLCFPGSGFAEIRKPSSSSQYLGFQFTRNATTGC
jgi:hypothetical protein